MTACQVLTKIFICTNLVHPMHCSINLNRVAIICKCLGTIQSTPSPNSEFALNKKHFILFNSSGNNAFSSLLSNKSPLHHPTVNQPPKNLMSNAPPGE